MKYWAYIPREDGTAPVGTGDQCLFSCKSERYARGMASRRLRYKPNIVIVRYTNLYDEKTYKTIYGKHIN